jgi:hypothetical protein
MRPLQQFETATLPLRKGKKDKLGGLGAFIGDSGEVLLAVLGVIEEAGYSLGQHLTVVEDEALTRAADTLAGAQGAGQEVAENVEKEIICEAGHCIPLVGGLHFKEPTTKIHFLLMRSKEKII